MQNAPKRGIVTHPHRFYTSTSGVVITRAYINIVHKVHRRSCSAHPHFLVACGCYGHVLAVRLGGGLGFGPDTGLWHLLKHGALVQARLFGPVVAIQRTWPEVQGVPLRMRQGQAVVVPQQSVARVASGFAFWRAVYVSEL